MSNFCKNFLSTQECGFQKGYRTQHYFLALLEKWKCAVDRDNGALLGDLSEAFDWLEHELLITKSNAYGFSLPTLKLVHNYFSQRKQRSKVITYSTWVEIIFGIPQGSTLGSMLFMIFLADLLNLNDVDIVSYAEVYIIHWYKTIHYTLI